MCRRDVVLGHERAGARGRRGCAVPASPARWMPPTVRSPSPPCARWSAGPAADRAARSSDFMRIGVRALLDDARAFAVILADDDHRAAHHAGRGEVGQRVGRDIGADDRLPGHRAAHRIIDRGAEHGGGGGLVGAGLDMHAEFLEVVLGMRPSRRAGARPARPDSRRRRTRPIAAAPWSRRECLRRGRVSPSPSFKRSRFRW